MPKRHEAVVFGALDQSGIERWKRRQGQLGACVCEGLLDDDARELCALAQVAEERVELSSDTHAHAAH